MLSRCGEDAYGNDLSPDERKRSLGHHSPPTQEAALSTSNVTVLDEWARVLPEAKTEPIMVRTTSKVEYDTKNDKALR